jgi:hypothetical protein
MKVFRIRVNIDLDYVLKAKSIKEAIEIVEDSDMPEEYVVDSFMIKNIEKIDLG